MDSNSIEVNAKERTAFPTWTNKHQKIPLLSLKNNNKHEPQLLNLNCIWLIMEGGAGVPSMNKAEIDTSAPFRSVKEAVVLFGERVLVRDLYANKIKEETMSQTDLDPLSELEETKQSLQKARDESIQMARSLSSLQQELKYTKFELKQLKIREHNKYAWDLQINEELKFVQDSTEQLMEETTGHGDHEVEYNKKKYVRFANPPVVAQVEAPPCEVAVLQRHPSLKNRKKKTLIPFIRRMFAKKKGGKTEFAMA